MALKAEDVFTPHNKKLFDRLLKRKPGQDYKADTEQQAHIINDQTISLGINHTKKHNRGKQQNLLQCIKEQILDIACLKTDHKEA